MEWNIIVAKIILTVLCGLMVWMLIVDPQNPLLQSLQLVFWIGYLMIDIVLRKERKSKIDRERRP